MMASRSAATFVMITLTVRTEFAMPEFSRPTTYLEKLRFAERVIKTAQFRSDPRQAIRELCEGMGELVVALIEREQGGGAAPRDAAADDAGQAPKKPTA